MNPMSPGMMGVADQGDAVEMGQRLGKFMGSFMREMKNSPERADPEEKPARRSEREYRSQPDYPNSGRDYDPRDSERRYEGNAQRKGHDTTQPYVPMYDPWGINRGNPLLDNDPWAGGYGGYYGRSPDYGYGRGPSGWGDAPPSIMAEQNWNRGRGYYGAGLAPWEYYEPGPDPRAERRWRDPSYYDPDYDPRQPDSVEGAYGPPWQSSPWSGGGERRNHWW